MTSDPRDHHSHPLEKAHVACAGLLASLSELAGNCEEGEELFPTFGRRWADAVFPPPRRSPLEPQGPLPSMPHEPEPPRKRKDADWDVAVTRNLDELKRIVGQLHHGLLLAERANGDDGVRLAFAASQRIEALPKGWRKMASLHEAVAAYVQDLLSMIVQVVRFKVRSMPAVEEPEKYQGRAFSFQMPTGYDEGEDEEGATYSLHSIRAVPELVTDDATWITTIGDQLDVTALRCWTIGIMEPLPNLGDLGAECEIEYARAGLIKGEGTASHNVEEPEPCAKFVAERVHPKLVRLTTTSGSLVGEITGGDLAGVAWFVLSAPSKARQLAEVVEHLWRMDREAVALRKDSSTASKTARCKACDERVKQWEEAPDNSGRRYCLPCYAELYRDTDERLREWPYGVDASPERQAVPIEQGGYSVERREEENVGRLLREVRSRLLDKAKDHWRTEGAVARWEDPSSLEIKDSFSH